MATFVILRHLATILVTDSTTHDNLTNDPLILKTFDEISTSVRLFNNNYQNDDTSDSTQLQ